MIRARPELSMKSNGSYVWDTSLGPEPAGTLCLRYDSFSSGRAGFLLTQKRSTGHAAII